MPKFCMNERRFEDLLSEYEKRPPAYSGDKVAERLRRLRSAHAIAEINDGPPLNNKTEIALRLLAEGKIDSKEHTELCQIVEKEAPTIVVPRGHAMPH